MTKSSRKILIVILSTLILFSACFCLMRSSLSKKAYAYEINSYQAENGVTIDTEYFLESRFLPTQASAIGFSGSYFRSGDTMTAGHLFSSTVDGAKVSLGNNFGEVLGYGVNNENANKFSLVGMTVPNASPDATEVLIAHPFNTLNFIITDNADSDNVINITFKSTTYPGSGVSGSGPIDVTATYNGTTLKTMDNKTTVNNLWRASFRNRYFEYAGYPFNLEFSQEDARLNFYGLNDGSLDSSITYLENCTAYSGNTVNGNIESFIVNNMTGFETYTVEMQFCDFTYAPQANNIEYKANVVLFEMASQVLSNSSTSANDTVGPMVEQKYSQVVTQKEYNLAELLTMNDIIEGKIDTVGNTEGTFSVKVDGVDCPTGKYTFTQNKDYSIEYTIYDTFNKAGVNKNRVTKTITVSGVVDEQAPVLAWDKSYKDNYYTNTQLSLLALSVNDDHDDAPNIVTKAYIKNGESWNELTVVENTVSLNVAGEYKVEYVVTDFSGNSATISDTFSVSDLVLNVEDEIEEDFITELFYIPVLALDEELSYYVEKFDVSDTNFVNGERINTRAIMFAEPCSFKLRYTVFGGNESSVVATKVVTVTLKQVGSSTPDLPNEPIVDEKPQADTTGGSFFTSVPFVIIVSVLMVASIAFNVVLIIKRRKNG